MRMLPMCTRSRARLLLRAADLSRLGDADQLAERAEKQASVRDGGRGVAGFAQGVAGEQLELVGRRAHDDDLAALGDAVQFAAGADGRAEEAALHLVAPAQLTAGG